MITRDYEAIITQIVKVSSRTREDVEYLISKKIAELEDLISKEGAAHIVANELNIKLFQSFASPQTFKIKDILPGFSSINVLGKVISIYEIRSYQKENRSGRVVSITIGDETGTIRATIWDEKIIEEVPKLKEGDIIKITNSYSRKNNMFTEIHLGNKSTMIINPPGESVLVSVKKVETPQKLSQLKPEEYANVFATIVDMYEPHYYDACPSCKKKVIESKCNTHGQITSDKVPILNFIIDDGTSSVRATAFRDVAMKLINNEPVFEKVKKDNLGRQLIFRGRIVKNEQYNSNDFILTHITEPEPTELIELFNNAL